MVFQGRRVLAEETFALAVGDVGGAGALVVEQDHLGVDDDVAVFGQQQQGVGPVAVAGFVLEAFLGEVLLAFLEAGAFEQAFELELAPVALGAVVGGQGPGEAAGLVAELAVEFEQLLEFGLKRDPLAAFLFIGVGYHLAEVHQLFAQRVEQLAQLVGVLFAEAARLVFQDFRGQGLEFGFQAFAGAFQVLVALLGGHLLGL